VPELKFQTLTIKHKIARIPILIAHQVVEIAVEGVEELLAQEEAEALISHDKKRSVCGI
jgi:hypothetical protein